MKIIQSFWTGKRTDLSHSYGWLSNSYHYLSWILSCNQLRKFYNEVELFTDQFGYTILIEQLKLPYTNVHVVLDELNKYDDNLWALAKIKAYSLMNEPFLHVDGDVFIFEPFNEKLLASSIITQNIETTSEYYWNMWSKIRPELHFIPESMFDYDNQNHNKAYNMGIFGGQDISFIKKYADSSFDFVDRNMESLSNINAYNFNIFFEQVLLYELANRYKVKVDYLIHEDIGDNEYHGFGNFEEVPDERRYLHLLGFYKRQDMICNKMSIYVQKYYPEFYMHLENLLDLKPKLSSFGFTYKRSDLKELSNDYIKLVCKGELNEWDEIKKIFCRNIVSEGMVNHFINFIDNNQDFYLVPLTNFNVDNDFTVLVVQLLHDESFIIELLSIDYVIFDIIKQPILYSDFIKRGIDFLDEDFPVEEIASFRETLWKRISIFISYGIFYPVKIEQHKTLASESFLTFCKSRQEDVDAGT